MQAGQRCHDRAGFFEGAASDLIPDSHMSEILEEQDEVRRSRIDVRVQALRISDRDMGRDVAVEADLALIHVERRGNRAVLGGRRWELGDNGLCAIVRADQHESHDPGEKAGAFPERLDREIVNRAFERRREPVYGDLIGMGWKSVHSGIGLRSRSATARSLASLVRWFWRDGRSVAEIAIETTGIEHAFCGAIR